MRQFRVGRCGPRRNLENASPIGGLVRGMDSAAFGRSRWRSGEASRADGRDSRLTVARSLPGRPRACGKFVYADEQKLWIKGAAYGTFRPDSAGDQFPAPDRVRADFAAMAASGINTVRTYTVPPGWLLDVADEHSLRVLVGVPWEQHGAFLIDRD